MALSEVQWCKPGNKDFEGFKTKLSEHEMKILDAMGYNYRRLD